MTSRYSNRLTYLKNKVTTNQKHSVDSQKTKPRKLKHNAEENHKTTKGTAGDRLSEANRGSRGAAVSFRLGGILT